MKLSRVLLSALLAVVTLIAAQSSNWASLGLRPDGDALCQELLFAFENNQPITITETLLNPFSIVQFDGSGQIVSVGHPTGIIF
jgi:hypothetical protein